MKKSIALYVGFHLLIILCMAGCQSSGQDIAEVRQSDLECGLLMQVEWGSGTGELGYLAEGESGSCPRKPFRFQIDAKGNIYVADLYNQRIVQFSSTGDFIRNFGIPTLEDNECIGDVAVGGGRIAVATTAHIYVYDQNDDSLKILEWPADAGQYGLCSEDAAGRKVQADDEGNVYACGVGSYERGGTVVQFDNNGHSHIFFTGSFNHLVVGWDGFVYIEQIDYGDTAKNSSGSRVLRFDFKGEQVGEITIPGRDLAKVDLIYPGLLIGVDARGNLYTNVVNVFRDRELVFREALIQIDAGGNISRIIERDEWTRPAADIVDKNGNLYIWNYGETPSEPVEIWHCSP